VRNVNSLTTLLARLRPQRPDASLGREMAPILWPIRDRRSSVCLAVIVFFPWGVHDSEEPERMKGRRRPRPFWFCFSTNTPGVPNDSPPFWESVEPSPV